MPWRVQKPSLSKNNHHFHYFTATNKWCAGIHNHWSKIIIMECSKNKTNESGDEVVMVKTMTSNERIARAMKIAEDTGALIDLVDDFHVDVPQNIHSQESSGNHMNDTIDLCTDDNDCKPSHVVTLNTVQADEVKRPSFLSDLGFESENPCNEKISKKQTESTCAHASNSSKRPSLMSRLDAPMESSSNQNRQQDQMPFANAYPSKQSSSSILNKKSTAFHEIRQYGGSHVEQALLDCFSYGVQARFTFGEIKMAIHRAYHYNDQHLTSRSMQDAVVEANEIYPGDPDLKKIMIKYMLALHRTRQVCKLSPYNSYTSLRLLIGKHCQGFQKYCPEGYGMSREMLRKDETSTLFVRYYRSFFPSFYH